MTEELKAPYLSVIRPSVDEIIEGKIEGVDFFTDEELEDVFVELGQLYIESQIKYERRRKELKPWFGCTLEAIDDEVKKWVDRNRLPALPEPAEDDVTELVAIGMGDDVVLWRNAKRKGYVSFNRDGHTENHEIESEDFEDFLSDEYGKEHEREINGRIVPCYPKSEDLNRAKRQLQAYAKRKEEQEPRIRIKDQDDELWIDLGNADWSAVVIDAEDWRIEEKIRAPLVRGDGMRPLPNPVRDGDIRELRQFVNVRDDDDFTLLCGSLATILNPFGSYHTFLISGPPNSAKTSITRAIRALTDPHEVDTRRVATIRDLQHGASLTHVIGLENIRYISPDLSDALCTLNTGMGYGERKLFAQGKEFQIKVRCPIIINGIPVNIATQPDLLDRVISFQCEHLGNRVLSEDGLKRRLAEAAPRMFGALLNGIVGAMKSRLEFGDNNDEAADVLLGGWKPRYIDAAVWGEAACRAMGFARGEYVRVLKNNKYNLQRTIAEAEPICIGIKKLFDKKGYWEGYPAQLSSAIGPYVPAAPNSVWLARDLAYFIGILHDVYGIRVLMNQRLSRDDNRNGIIITSIFEESHGGRYFSTTPEASGEEEKPTPDEQPQNITTDKERENHENPTVQSSAGKTAFRRRI
jgi:hypothetical protein